jgi:hypothetical protein
MLSFAAAFRSHSTTSKYSPLASRRSAEVGSTSIETSWVPTSARPPRHQRVGVDHENPGREHGLT